MDKKTIIKLALVITGIFLLIFGSENLISQLVYIESIQAGFELKSIITEFILYITFSFGIGLLLIFNPELIMKIVFKDIESENSKAEIYIDKYGILQMAILIISLYFLIAALPGFISNVYMLTKTFTTDFNRFNIQAIEFWPTIAWYITIIIVFMNNKTIAGYIYKKLKL